jgi:hypothetical protein
MFKFDISKVVPCSALLASALIAAAAFSGAVWRSPAVP